MFELTYECDNHSAGLAATDTAVESLEIIIRRIKSRSLGGPLREINLRRVEKPSPGQDGWGRTIE